MCLVHSWQKRLLHPGMMCLFCDYFYFISPRGLRTGCLVWYNVFYVFDALFFYSVVFCQFWRHLMIKWVIDRMCITKCHWKIIVVNLVEQRWFFSWRCLVVSFCVCQVNIGYSRLSRRLSPLVVKAYLLQGAEGVVWLYRDLRPFIQQGLAKLIKILRRIVHRADCSAQFIPKMFYGVTVGRSWRLLHLCDIALL